MTKMRQKDRLRGKTIGYHKESNEVAAIATAQPQWKPT